MKQLNGLALTGPTRLVEEESVAVNEVLDEAVSILRQTDATSSIRTETLMEENDDRAQGLVQRFRSRW